MPNYLFSSFPEDTGTWARVLGWGSWVSLTEAVEACGCPGTLTVASSVCHTLLRAAFQGALWVKTLDLGWNVCFVQFLGVLLRAAALLAGRGRPSLILTPKFALLELKIYCYPGCCGSCLLGVVEGSWVVKLQGFTRRHEERVILQESWGCTQQVTVEIRCAMGKDVLESQPWHPRGGL